jgi:hypothetical protein
LRVIFIASLSHSGSTLLDLMLNAHPDVVSVGELKQLGRFARLEKPSRRLCCSCGAETLLHCAFWSGVSELTQSSVGRSISEVNVENYKDRERFGEDNLALFQAIATVAEKTHVVDSSKSAARLSLLISNSSLDVFPIFLLRDPKGQICSARRRPISLPHLIGSYVRTNREIHAAVRDRPHAVIHYEELVKRPAETLDRLMRAMGLSFDPRQLEWAAPVRHNVGGNGMRRGTSSALKLDERWRQKFSLMQKVAIDIGTVPGRYPFLKIAP